MLQCKQARSYIWIAFHSEGGGGMTSLHNLQANKYRFLS